MCEHRNSGKCASLGAFGENDIFKMAAILSNSTTHHILAINIHLYMTEAIMYSC